MLAGLLSTLLAGCATTGAMRPPVPSDEVDDCPEPPGIMTSVAQLQLISRVTREARANLLVQGTLNGERVVATLHPPRLALAEGVLAGPRRARRRDPRWLSRHLDTTFVDLQCAKALPSLELNLADVALTDGAGKRAPLLSFTRYREGGQLRYHLVFGAPIDANARAQWTLELPTSKGKPLKLGWSVAAANPERFDELPLLFSLAHLRAQARARRAALAGDPRRGLRHLEDVLDCSADPGPAKALAARLLMTLKPARVVTIPLVAGGEDEPSLTPKRGAPEGSLRDGLALRVAISQVLAQSAARGLIDGVRFSRAIEELRRAAGAMNEGKAKDAIELTLAHDRELARLLREAARPTGKLHPWTTPLSLSARGVTISTARVAAALRRRVAAASLGLEPRWISAAGQRTPDDVRALLTSRGTDTLELAMATERLGLGFWHPGLRPKTTYAIGFKDIGPGHWRRLARDAKGLDGLRALARRVLARERHTGGRAASLAVAGVVALAKSPAELKPLLADGATMPAALRKLALSEDPSAEGRLLRHARGSSVDHKTAALAGLGWRALRGRLSRDAKPLLNAALDSPNTAASVLAALGLVTARDRKAAEKVVSWLRDDRRRSEVLLGLLVTPNTRLTATLGPALRRALRGKVNPQLVEAAARLGDRASLRALRSLYKKAPLRPMLLEAAARAQCGPLLALLDPSEKVDLGVQRRVVIALSSVPKGQEARLQGWLSGSQDRRVRAAAQVGLARLKQGLALLALGASARGSCLLRTLAIPVLSASMDRSSRRKLLLDAIAACPDHASELWRPVVALQAKDPELLRAGLGHQRPEVRVQAALTVLGLRRGAALGLPGFAAW